MYIYSRSANILEAIVAKSTGETMSKKIFALIMTLAIGLVSFVAITPASAAVDTCTWVGTTGVWDLASNWSCNTDGVAVPGAGDDVVFTSAGTKAVVIDDMNVINDVNITGTGYAFSTTDATVFTMDGPSAILDTTQSVTFDAPVAFMLTGGGIKNFAARATTGTTVTFNSTVSMNSTDGELDFGSSGRTGTFDFVGAITGTSNQVIAQQGATVQARGTNTATVDTFGAETGGIFECRNENCFGNPASRIYISDATVKILVTGIFVQDIVTSTGPADSHLEAYQGVSFTGDVDVNSDLTVAQLGTGPQSLQFTAGSQFDLAADARLTVEGVDSNDSQVRLDGGIIGINDNGVLVDDVRAIFANTSTFDGSFIVAQGGLVRVTSVNALSDATIEVVAGGSVEMNLPSAGTFANDWFIEGVGISGDSQGAIANIADFGLTLSGDIQLADEAGIGEASACVTSHDMVLSGVISGTGDLQTYVAVIPCSIVITGAQPNTFDGDLLHVSGYLSLDKDMAVPGNVVLVPDHSTSSTYVRVEGGNTNVVGGGLASLGAVDSDEYFNVYDDESVSGLYSDTLSRFNVCGGTTLTVNQDEDSEFAGKFNSPAGCAGSGLREVTKTGSGILDITGDDPSDTGTQINVNGGVVAVNANRAGTPVVINGGTLIGNATLGSITGVTGHLNVGNSPGCMTVASLSLTAGFNFDQEINGGTACSGYDRTTSTGAVVLGNAKLNIVLGTNPPVGTSFTIIQALSVNGTFNNLANNAVLDVNGVKFRVNYTATAVTLTVVPASTAATAGTLPATGFDSIDFAVLAMTIAALGYALYVAASKRRRLSIK